MTSFHFDCGDSNHGPIGFCARVKATNREEACKLLKEGLPDTITFTKFEHPAIQYLNVYFGPVTVDMSDPSMDEPCPDSTKSPDESRNQGVTN